MKKIHSLKVYILYYFILAVLIGSVLCFNYAFYSLRYAAKKTANHLLENAKNEIEADMFASINLMFSMKITNCSQLIGKKAELIQKQDLLNLKSELGASEISIFDKTGKMIQTTESDDFLGFDYHDSELLINMRKKFRQEHISISFFEKSLYDNPNTFMYGFSYCSTEYFLLIGYSKEYFFSTVNVILKSYVSEYSGAYSCDYFILNEDEILVSPHIYHLDKSLYGTTIDLIKNYKEDSIYLLNIFNGKYYFSYKQIFGKYMFLLYSYKTSEQFILENLVKVFLGILLIVLISLFLLFIFLNKSIIKNIFIINKKLQEISNGNFDKKLSISSSLEFTQLSDAINYTVDSLKDYIKNEEQRNRRELKLAKTIQHSVLPRFIPQNSYFTLFAFMEAAKDVGGDFYDYYFIDENHFAITVADVSDKGIPASLFMMNSKATIRQLAMSKLPIEEVFTKANNILCANNEANMFVTAWLGVIDLTTGVLNYVNGGHNPPLIKLKDKYEFLISESNFVLGQIDDIEYQGCNLQLADDSQIFLYTDGVTEATNSKGDMYSEQKLLDTLNRIKNENMENICKGIKSDLQTFVGEAEQSDDVTMLSFKYEGTHQKSLTINANIENVDVVIDFINDYLESLNCDMKKQAQIDICIDEIFSNIANYAYEDKVGKVTVCVNQVNNFVKITFEDEGIPYNPLVCQTPDINVSLEERKEGGLGIYLTKQLSDNIVYEYRNKKNITTIIKEL